MNVRIQRVLSTHLLIRSAYKSTLNGSGFGCQGVVLMPLHCITREPHEALVLDRDI